MTNICRGRSIFVLIWDFFQNTKITKTWKIDGVTIFLNVKVGSWALVKLNWSYWKISDLSCASQFHEKSYMYQTSISKDWEIVFRFLGIFIINDYTSKGVKSSNKFKLTSQVRAEQFVNQKMIWINLLIPGYFSFYL